MTSESKGWDAIDRALAPLYGDVEPPFHYGTVVKWMLGGPDPLDGISVYRVEEPVPHWHFVSYGLTELYDKDSDDPEVSGWGFELTLRLVRGPEETPPGWAMGLLQNLARYVFRSGNPFDEHHHLNANGPIALEAETALKAVLFVRDPLLPPQQTPYGRMKFLQVVGITLDEYELLRDWSAEGVAAALAEARPLLTTDLARTSILDDPSRAQALRTRAAEEGSSLGVVFATWVQWSAVEGGARLTLSVRCVDDLLRMLKGRTLFGRDFHLVSREAGVHVIPGEQPGFREPDGGPELVLDRATAEAMRTTLEPKRGTYAWPALPGFTLEVID
jgi:hypothetical protein